MQATIGKYMVNIEKTHLICTHPTGISFDFTLDEALGLMEFISVYQGTIRAVQQDQRPTGDPSDKSKTVNEHHISQSLDDIEE